MFKGKFIFYRKFSSPKFFLRLKISSPVHPSPPLCTADAVCIPGPSGRALCTADAYAYLARPVAPSARSAACARPYMCAGAYARPRALTWSTVCTRARLTAPRNGGRSRGGAYRAYRRVYITATLEPRGTPSLYRAKIL